MKKGVDLLLIGFLVLGIFMNAFFVLADDNNSGLGNHVISANVGLTGNADDSGNGSGVEVQANETNQGEDSQIQARVQERDQGESFVNGTRVRTQREVQVEDGKTSVQIQRTVTYANGTQVQIQIQIETEDHGNGTVTRQIHVEKDGEDYNVSVEHDLNVSDEFVGNQSQIVARLSDGRDVNVSVLPNEALNATLARLRIRERLVNNGTNVSIQLKESVHNNVPQVVYNVETNQDGRFLGIFKIALKSNTEVNSENGQVVAVNQPWWAFLVAVPSSSAGSSGSVNESSNATNSS